MIVCSKNYGLPCVIGGKKRMLCVMGMTRIVDCMQKIVGVISSIGGKSEKRSLRGLCSLPREVVTADQDSEIDHDQVELWIGVQLAQGT